MYLIQLYKNDDLDILNEESKHSCYRFKLLDLDFIDLKQKQYFISEQVDDDNLYTLYEYCILSKKYKYIKKYCWYKLKRSLAYSTKNFVNCFMHENIESIYYCMMEGAWSNIQNNYNF